MNTSDSTCKHASVPTPAFDAEKAQNMTTSEIRQAYPRFSGMCPDCRCSLIKYASFEHYIAGDW